MDVFFFLFILFFPVDGWGEEGGDGDEGDEEDEERRKRCSFGHCGVGCPKVRM